MKTPSITRIFDNLYSNYGSQRWWPGEGQFEIILGAILTQNTTWHNAALAIANLAAADLLEPDALFATPPEDTKALIAPAGYFNIKYKRIRNFLEYLNEHDMDLERFCNLPVVELREELLKVNGVGPETADSILLYAFGRPIFVVDEYTKRLFSRLGYGWMEKASYEEIQSFFMQELPSDVRIYNEYHALIVAHCKDTCRKRTPMCLACTLSSSCAAHQMSLFRK
jgi:endonuclease-3 related protein